MGFEEISVIVQGPIDWSMDERHMMATTHALCANVRRFLPGAEIILSTWDDQRYDGLDIDRVVLNKDPGPQGAWPSFVPTNINRQIISTVAGLKTAKRTYCLKCRTDIVLEGNDFIRAYESLRSINADPWRIFERPIVSNNLTSRNSIEVLKRIPDHPLLFHPSDHVHFGARKDLMTLWDVPLQSDEDAFFFLDRAQPNRWRYHELGRLTPEQFLLMSAIAKNMKVDFPNYAYHSDLSTKMSDYYMRTHFLFIPDRSFPIHFAKYHTDHHFSFEWMRINPDPGAPAVTHEKVKIERDWRWKLAYPFRNPAGFRRWLKKRMPFKT